MQKPPENIIEIRGLWTVFGDFVVHRDLDLDVESGEIISIVGGSGSGKTVPNKALETFGVCVGGDGFPRWQMRQHKFGKVSGGRWVGWV